MAIIRKISDATVIVDNIVMAYVPNSLTYKEGLGEQKIRIQTGGGGAVQQVLSDDITTKHAMVKFDVEPTAENINNMRAIKANMDGHVITISAAGFTRTITGALLTSDYEVKLGAEDVFTVEFIGNPAI